MNNDIKLLCYKYTAKNTFDQKVKGSIIAPSTREANNRLTNQDLSNIKLTLNNSLLDSILSINIGKSLTDEDLSIFLIELSTLLKGGIKVDEALEMIANEQSKQSLKMLYYKVYYNLSAGMSLSKALESLGTNVFPKHVISMFSVAEKTGKIIEVALDLSDFYTKNASFKKSIRSAFVMPLLYLTFALIVGIFLIVTIVPQFEESFESAGKDLPGITQALLIVYDFLKNNIFYVIITTIISILLLYILFKKSYSFKRACYGILMRLPAFSKLIKYSNLSIITSTLAMLFDSKVSSQESLTLAKNTVSNPVYTEILDRSKRDIIEGRKLSLAFSSHWAVEPIVYRLIVVGEKTSELPLMFNNLKTYYEDNYERQVTGFKKALEPILMFIIYIMIGFLVLAIMLPTIQQNTTI